MDKVISAQFVEAVSRPGGGMQMIGYSPVDTGITCHRDGGLLIMSTVKNGQIHRTCVPLANVRGFALAPEDISTPENTGAVLDEAPKPRGRRPATP